MPPPYRRTRKTYRRRTYKRRATRSSIYGRAGRQLWKDVNTLKNFINVEFKVKDTFTNTTQMPSTGTIDVLNGLQQGDDYNRRSGRQVRWKSFQWRIGLNKHASATASRARVIFFIDKEPRQVQCSTSDIMEVSTFDAIEAFRQ